ncbi:MAG: Unknown protein [uncultured Thiotrichaceae bacterium]|uniref:Uncharacterized protein n=1 Tax=uncultured Thiotrichaceae bacterium TaxID=298394 RepID=A0A6S6TJ32_9GAMM|nr:MAG: Unknown protein [uncultured Thiotrichaceae bacterium]
MIKRYSLIALIISFIFIAVFYWWFQGDLVLTGLYALLSALAVFSVPLVYRFAGFSLADDMLWLRERETREHAELTQRIIQLKSELESLNLAEGSRQANVLTGIIDDYHAVVETRFFGKKNSPLTYLGAARTVQKHAVQNLADMVAIGHSMSGISRNQRDPAMISNTRQQNRLDKQTGLYDEQEKRLSELREENNQLFDALTETAVEVANIRSFSQFDRTDTFARLLALAQVASDSGK